MTTEDMELFRTGDDPRLTALPTPRKPSQPELDHMTELDRQNALDRFAQEQDAFVARAMRRPAGRLNAEERAAIAAGIREYCRAEKG